MFKFKRPPSLARQFEDAITKPTTVKERRKMMVPVALELKKTVDTKGWKEIIEPFFERHGDPSKMFRLRKKLAKGEITEEEFNQEVAQIEAYYHLLRFINQVVGVLESEDPDEDGGDEFEGDYVEDEEPLGSIRDDQKVRE